MKIGIWLQEGYNPALGGGFSYYDKLVKAIDNIPTQNHLDFCFVSMSYSYGKTLKKDVVKMSFFPSILRNVPLLGKFFRFVDWKILKFYGDKIARKKNIGFIVYLTQNVCFSTKIPFISTNWDIGHLSTFAFPELMSDKQFKRRNDFYQNILPRALMVLADSEAGKKELIQYTKIGPHKIEVMPIFAGNVTNINPTVQEQNETCLHYKVEKFKYFIYPAQYWAHKNHYGLIKAFSKFIKIHPDYKLLLCGSDKGNKSYIQEQVRALQLESSVVFLGFVSNEELASLYLNATALVMASHFGPTNMPPIEALDMNIPVVCSDIDGHREILGESASYFDSFNPETITFALNRVVDNRCYFLKKIEERRLKSKFKIDYTMSKFIEYMNKAVEVRSNWPL